MSHYIWTNHALQRLRERRIPQSLVNEALHHPDRTFHRPDGTRELQKRIDGRTVAAIVKEDGGENIILSCWINPPFPGTRDFKKRKRYLEMQKGSFWKKLWLTLLDQLGL